MDSPIIKYLRTLVQLTLSPERGWEDVSAMTPGVDVEAMAKRAYCPLLVVAALSEFVPVIYGNVGIPTAIEMAIALTGAYLVSFFVARALMLQYLPSLSDAEVNRKKVTVFAGCGMGLLLLIEIFENLFPANLTLLKFMPLFAALVLYRATRYLSIRQGVEIRFLFLAAGAVIVLPTLLLAMLKLLID